MDSIKKKGRYTRVDIVDILKKSGDMVDREIYIGGNSKARMKVRLIATRLPELEYIYYKYTGRHAVCQNSM